MSNSENTNLKKFTYGHQFEPEKFSLTEITKLCQDYEPNREYLEQQILNRYFINHSQQSSNQGSVSNNQKKLAMNCFLSLRAYQIIETIDQHGNKTSDRRSKLYKLTEIGEKILEQQQHINDIYRLFSQHILTNLTGMSLLKSIEAINTRGETPTLELIAYELQEMGYSISPNAIYTSTMRKWLKIAGVLEKEYDINWDIVYELLGANKDYVDELYTLTSPQKYFLLSMIQLDVKDFTPWNEIAKYAKSRYQIRLPSKTFVKDIIEPLVSIDLIETKKITTGRGAKPNLVRVTEKAKNELITSLISTIANLTNISETELIRSYR